MAGHFSEREKAFEEKWAHDEELRFKVVAHRNRLLGLWAAEQMGLAAEAARDYAKAVVAAELTREGDEAVFKKLKSDLAAAKIERTDHLIRRKMDEFMTAARGEMMRES